MLIYKLHNYDTGEPLIVNPDDGFHTITTDKDSSHIQTWTNNTARLVRANLKWEEITDV